MILSPRLSCYSQQTDITLLYPCDPQLSTCSLPSEKQDGFGELFVRHDSELVHWQPSKFLDLDTRITLKLAEKRSERTVSPSPKVVHLAEPGLEVVEETFSCTFEEMFHGLTPTIYLMLRCRTTSSRGLKRIIL